MTALVLLAPAVIGTAALLMVARRGAYASPDSAFYVGVARNLIDGAGWVAPPGSPPLAHFPPLFPMLLAGAGRLLGVDPLDAAAVVNPLLFGVTAVVVAGVARARRASVPVGVAAAVAAVVGLDLLVYGASALSEPLFTLLVLAALVVLARAVARRSDGLLGLAAALTGAACLTRYIGVALVIAGAGALWHLESGRRRWRAVAFAAGASFPLVIWVTFAGRASRPLSVHLFDVRYWSTGIGSLSRWVLPPFVPWPIRLVVLVGLVVALRRLPRTARADPLPLLAAAFGACYLAVLVGDRLVLDDTGRLDARFLAPLHVVALVVLVPLIARAAGRARVGVLVLLALHGLQAVAWTVTGLTDDGVDRRGLSGRAWRDSPVMAAVAALPAGVPVYSNAADAVFLLLGRRTSSVPPERDYLTGAATEGYDDAMAAMAEDLRRAGAVVVYFEPFDFRRQFLPTLQDVGRAVPLRVVATDTVATLYRAAATASSSAGSQATRSASRLSLENTSTSG